MKLWCISDWHMETRLVFEPPRPDFDVLVCAGDVEEHIARAIEMVAALAGGKPAVFVAGNHDWRGPESLEKKLDAAHEAARKHGVHFLECDTCQIGRIRFAGATLWTPDDPRFAPSAAALIKAGADVVVTHFEPAPELLMRALPTGGLWVYGHHHGHSVQRIGARVLIRNAIGHGNEPLDGAPAIPDYVFEI